MPKHKIICEFCFSDYAPIDTKIIVMKFMKHFMKKRADVDFKGKIEPDKKEGVLVCCTKERIKGSADWRSRNFTFGDLQEFIVGLVTNDIATTREIIEASTEVCTYTEIRGE